MDDFLSCFISFLTGLLTLHFAFPEEIDLDAALLYQVCVFSALASIPFTLLISAAEFLKWRKVEEKAIEDDATADPAEEPAASFAAEPAADPALDTELAAEVVEAADGPAAETEPAEGPAASFAEEPAADPALDTEFAAEMDGPAGETEVTCEKVEEVS